MREVRFEINLLPKVKYDSHLTDFHETRAYSSTFYKEFLYRIS